MKATNAMMTANESHEGNEGVKVKAMKVNEAAMKTIRKRTWWKLLVKKALKAKKAMKAIKHPLPYYWRLLRTLADEAESGRSCIVVQND